MNKLSRQFLAMLVTVIVAFQSVQMQVYAAGIDDTTLTQNVEEEEQEQTILNEENEEEAEEEESEESSDDSEPADTSQSEVEQPTGTEETVTEEPTNGEVTEEQTEEQTEEESAEESEEDLEEVEEEEEEELLNAADEDSFTISANGTLTAFVPGSTFNGTVEIPEGAESIDVNCFSGLSAGDKAKITTVIFPESLSVIPDGAFAGCTNISSIEFKCTSSLSVTGKAFSDCALTDIKIAEGISSLPSKFMSEAGYGPNATVHIPASVRKIEKSAFEAYGTTYTIANLDFASGSRLRSIATDAFQNCTSIASISFPETLEGIGNYSFLGCTKLASVSFGDNSALTTIGTEAFYNCTSLTSITIPENVTVIHDEAFRNSGLTTLVVNSTKLSSEYGYIFTGCKISSVILPEGMTTVPKIFYHAGFASGTTITIPASVTKIADYAFNASNIYGIEFEGDAVTSIGTCAFEDCSNLTNIVLPSKLKSLGSGAFKSCSSLKSIVIPDTMTSVPSHAFEWCTSASSITIGSKVSSIGAYAFMGCTSVRELTIPNNVTSLGKAAFDRCSSVRKLTVSSNVTSLPYRALGHMSSLDELYLGDNIVSVVNGAEYGLEGTDQSSLDIYITSTSTKTYAALKVAISKGWLSKNQIIFSTKLGYQLNGGSAVGTYPSSYVNDEGSSSNILLHHPVKEGYVFAGWYLDAKFTKPIGRNNTSYSYIPISSLTGKATLYAKWVGPTFYDVTLDAAGGTVAYSTIRVALNGKYGEHDSITSFGLPTVTAPANKIFIGWFDENNELVTDSTVVKATAAGQTLKAKYKSTVTEVETPEINAVGYGVLSDGDEVQTGTKLYLTSETSGASISYTITDSSSNTYKEGVYSSNIALAEEGTYTIKATASLDGVDSAEATVSVTVVDASAPNGYTSDKANALWVQYKNTAEWDESSVKTIYTGAAVKFVNGDDYVVYYGKTELVEGTDYTVSYANNTKVADYDAKNAKGTSIAPTMTIKGKGSISGSKEYCFGITAQSANAIKLTSSNVKIALDNTSLVYDGTEKEPALTITYTKTGETVPASEYSVTYMNNVKVGTATATITFDGSNYYGSVAKTYKITALNLNQANTSGGTAIEIQKAAAVPYNKTDLSGLTSITLVSTGKTLVEKTDYTKKITTKTDKTTGVITATMTLTGKGNYAGTTSFTYEITKVDIDTLNVTNLLPAIYTGKKNVYQPVTYSVVDGTATLKKNTDYTVISFEVKQPGEADFEPANSKTVYAAGSEVRMILTGKGYYTGTKSVDYSIAASYDLTDANIVSITASNVTYSGKANSYIPKVTAMNLYTGKALGGGNYVLENYRYANETVVTRVVNKKTVYEVVDAGTAVNKTDIIPAGTYIYVDITGKGSYSGTVTRKYKVIYDMSKATINVANQTYTGHYIVPEKADITVKIGSTVLSANDYEIVSCTNNIKAGTAKVTIKGNGAFTGTKTVKFKIVAKKL
ncbi:leucine-rich repeat protein [Pseudobutyrivibrio ruminis]|uniref:Listeria/Bacterioides repeat-containing protein n=1 Tax=Pseudobutyrivibrio ruminis DSM 9787 TaxID=1123011 RepID=A0A285S8S3_9FIRM|nr:leucine-rich repeat protein [Pseudobutyrivibrio ruminis]SOC03983.1 Listeria/Bacterioides repeat-containing protein [Pseudobutyrivibrio ruminis DSM 9787]